MKYPVEPAAAGRAAAILPHADAAQGHRGGRVAERDEVTAREFEVAEIVHIALSEFEQQPASA